MKKKLTLVVTCIVLVAAMVIGGTLAYFTDTDKATNTFTTGNVKIDLIEQERGENGLQDFTQKKVLNPGTSTDGNAVSKIVTVKNEGANAAWVWVDLLIPSDLLDEKNPVDQSKNALHFNEYGAFNQRYWKTYQPTEDTNAPVVDKIMAKNADGEYEVIVENMVQVSADTVWTDWAVAGTETIGDVEYTILRTKMVGTLGAGQITLPCLRQLYMDWRVTSDGTTYTLPNGKTRPVSATWDVVVRAYAIQANGIASVDAAVTAYANNGK